VQQARPDTAPGFLLGVCRCMSRLRALLQECHNTGAQEDDDYLILGFIFHFAWRSRRFMPRWPVSIACYFLLFLLPGLLNHPCSSLCYWHLFQVLLWFAVV